MAYRTLANLGLTAVLLMGLALPAFADTSNIHGTIHRISGDMSGTKVLNLGIGNENIIQVNNPTDHPISFSLPAYGIRDVIPAHQTQSYNLNTVDLIERYVFYSINSQGGASTSTQTSTWTSKSTQSLDKIINYSTDYEVTNDPEPYYHEPQPYVEPPAPPAHPVKKHMIRGYW